MRTFNYSDLTGNEIKTLVQRNVDPANEVRAIVEEVIEKVKANGDSALLDYALKFDKVELDSLFLGKVQLTEIASAVSAEQREALQTAYDNIYKFHLAQL